MYHTESSILYHALTVTLMNGSILDKLKTKKQPDYNKMQGQSEGATVKKYI